MKKFKICTGRKKGVLYGREKKYSDSFAAVYGEKEKKGPGHFQAEKIDSASLFFYTI